VPAAKALIIVFHGNGQDIGMFDYYIHSFKRSGASVLLFEYPGYGLSQGARTAANVNSHAETAYNYARTTLGVAANKIFFYGYSIGTGVAIELAAKLNDKDEHIGGLMVQASYTSTTNIAGDIAWKQAHISPLVVQTLLPAVIGHEGWDSISKITKITCPFFLFHGEKDELIGVNHAKELYAASVNSHKKQLSLDPQVTSLTMNVLVNINHH